MLRVVLASASPRRRALLEAAGVEVMVRATPCDESVRPAEAALDYARRIAVAKLQAARNQHAAGADGGAAASDSPRAWLAADTIVWFPPDGAPLHKPSTIAQAREHVVRLTAGVPHAVTTAWALALGDEAPRVEHDTTRVFMRPLAAPELERYLETEQWRDKAGGYGIQDAAAAWVTRIEGSYTNVVGLPVAQVIERLRARLAAGGSR